MNSIIVYRNPFEQWFWESGDAWILLIPIAIAYAIFKWQEKK